MTLFRRKDVVPIEEAKVAPRPGDHAAGTTDICSALFDVCRHCQESYLDSLGAACMFDVDGGRVPSWMYEMLRAVIEMVVADIAGRAGPRVPGAAVGVTLRRSGNFWALAIAENLSGEAGEARAVRRLTMVRALTDRLDCVCRILPNAWGSTIAVAFPISDTATGGGLPVPVNRVLH